MTNVLEVKNVTKRIGKKTIIKDINFEIKEGEVFGLVGPNGAGKSTLIKTMLGLDKLTEGTTLINGYDVRKDFENALQEVGAIIENPEAYDYLTAKKNMEIFSRMYGKVDKQQIDELLKLVKLEDRKNHRVRTFSLGMKQRLGIAISLIPNPKLLILDEPTNGLDPIGIKELRDLIKNVSKEKGAAVLISSHILSEIELICDRIAIIDNGEIIEIIEPKKVDENIEIIDVGLKVEDVTKTYEFLLSKGISSIVKDDYIFVKTTKKNIPSINKLLLDNGIMVYEIKMMKKSLEDEFVERTKGSKGQLR